jgi:hypothetical protein
MLPINLDGLFPGVCQDDELGRPAVVIRAKTHDVHLSHGGRKIGKKPGQSKGEVLLKNRNARLPGGHFFILHLGQNPVMCRSHDPPRDRAKMDALAREYHDTHDPEIPEQIFDLTRQLGEMEH